MIVYLDMDGVLADFFGGLCKKFEVEHWKQIPDIDRAIDSLKGTDFFFQLEPFREKEFRSGVGIVSLSYELIRFVRNLTGDNWGICSAPLRGDVSNSSYWKRRWLDKYDWMPPVQNCIFESNKEKYAVSEIDGTPNILVDDKPSKVAKWNAAGGIGIRYQADEDDLWEYLMPKLKESYIK